MYRLRRVHLWSSVYYLRALERGSFARKHLLPWRAASRYHLLR
jgi:hypothetical protein